MVPDRGSPESIIVSRKLLCLREDLSSVPESVGIVSLVDQLSFCDSYIWVSV